jgi:hypothetical protein
MLVKQGVGQPVRGLARVQIPVLLIRSVPLLLPTLSDALLVIMQILEQVFRGTPMPEFIGVKHCCQFPSFEVLIEVGLTRVE